MLVILEDPTGSSRIRPAIELDCSVTLHENVARAIPGGADYAVWLNGEEVKDPAVGLQRLAMAGDMLTLVRRPEGFDPFTWAYIVVAALVAVTVLTMQQRPNYEAGSQNDSPNNRLTGQTNIARTYYARPDVYGKVRCWPDLIQNSTFEYIGNVKHVTEWMCISRGKGTITNFQYADTPITDISGSSITIFEPVPGDGGLYENGSTTMTNVLETFDSPEVNGQELKPSNAWVSHDGPAAIETTAGSAVFTVRTPISTDWDKVLILAASGGTVRVTFPVSTTPPDTFNQDVAITGAITSGSDYVFTFVAASAWASTSTIMATVSMLPYGEDYSFVGPFTLPVDGDRLRWHYNFLRGLKGSVVIRAEWWAIDAGGAEVPGTRSFSDNTCSANSYDGQYFTFGATPSAGYRKYRVRFYRLSGTVSDEGADVGKLEEVSIGRYYASKVLPGDTIVSVTTSATSEATGYSERKFNCEFQRHVLHLGDGSQSPSRNFARAIRHMWAVAGLDAEELDVDSLQSINDDLGEDSELLRFDYTFADRDMSLGERIRLSANHARCEVYRDGRQWVVFRDQLRSVGASRQFDYRNLSAKGESSISESGHLPSTEDGVEVEYVAEDGKTKAYARLRIAADGVISVGQSGAPRKVQLLGCRTDSQAMNRAHLEARKIIYQRRRVSDTALMDAAIVGIGEVVRWIDPADFLGDDGLQAGEVLAVDGNVVSTSEPLNFGDSAVGRIVFTGQDGSSSAQISCSPRTDGKNGCVCTSIPGQVYVADDDRQCGSRYAFAVGLTEAELESAGLYVVESKKPNGNGEIAIELASYHPKFYEMD